MILYRQNAVLSVSPSALPWSILKQKCCGTGETILVIDICFAWLFLLSLSFLKVIKYFNVKWSSCSLAVAREGGGAQIHSESILLNQKMRSTLFSLLTLWPSLTSVAHLESPSVVWWDYFPVSVDDATERVAFGTVEAIQKNVTRNGCVLNYR